MSIVEAHRPNPSGYAFFFHGENPATDPVFENDLTDIKEMWNGSNTYGHTP
jgi:hypothetical protein